MGNNYVNSSIAKALCDICGEEKTCSILRRTGDTMRIRICLQCANQLVHAMLETYRPDDC